METTDKITKDYLLNMKIGEKQTFLLVGKDFQRIKGLNSRLYEKGYSFLINKLRKSDIVNIKRLE